METNERKGNAGRPPKIQRFSEALEDVLNTPHSVGYAIIHTDADLIEMVNYRLEPDERISGETMRRWKNGEIKDDTLLDIFRVLYKRALMEQRDNLFDRLSSDVPGAWQKWAWILERKFDDWNLRTKAVDETPKPKELVFRVRQDGAPD